MTPDQTFLDQIADYWFIFHGSPYSTRQMHVANLGALVDFIRAEQKLMRAANVPKRTISGRINLLDMSLANRVQVPAIVELGALGPAGGGNGVSVRLKHQQAGHILIAAGGCGTRGSATPGHGGSADVMGTAESLLIAIGGDGASPVAPPTMPYGANGTNGGIGGPARASASHDGNVIYATAGDGAKGSQGQIGAPGSAGITMFGVTVFASPPGPAGTNGNDGNGGNAYAIGKNSSDFFAQGGKAPAAGNPFPTIAGTAGLPGAATITTGPTDVVVIGLRNGDGTAGTHKIVP